MSDEMLTRPERPIQYESLVTEALEHFCNFGDGEIDAFHEVQEYMDDLEDYLDLMEDRAKYADAMAAAVEFLQGELEAKENNLFWQREEIATLMDSVCELEDELEAKQIAFDREREGRASLLSDLEMACKERDSLREELDGAQSLNKATFGSLNRHEDEVAALKGQVNQLTQELAMAQIKLTGVQLLLR